MFAGPLPKSGPVLFSEGRMPQARKRTNKGLVRKDRRHRGYGMRQREEKSKEDRLTRKAAKKSRTSTNKASVPTSGKTHLLRACGN